jgi:SAM-dependent methyltransferase
MDNMPSRVQFLPTEQELSEDSGMTLNLYECEYCGLIQFDCSPVYYYKDVIRAVGLSPTLKELRIRQYRDLIEKYDLCGKKIWEIGCGGGEFLALWDGLGVSSFGVEHNDDLIKKAKDNGLTVNKGFVDRNYIDPNGPFDAFVSFNYLEHQPDPVSMVEGIFNNLKEGGIGLLTVPSFEYFVEKASYYEFMRDHIAYYTERALQNLFLMNGFDVCEIRRFNGDTTEIIVRKRKPVVLPDFEGQRIKIEQKLNSFVESHKDIERTAVWGASHQGLTMMATLELQFKPQYIVDSSPLKWNAYSTVSHLEIVDPQRAYADKPDLIIIMAPAFSKEIAKQIRDNVPDMKYILAVKDDEVLVL